MNKKDKKNKELFEESVKIVTNTGKLLILQQQLKNAKTKEEIAEIGKKVDELIKEAEDAMKKFDRLTNKEK